MKKLKKPNAIDRAAEMMLIPLSELPKPALAYMQKLSTEFGQCGETMLTAYAHYAQVVEKRPCKEGPYRADQKAKNFFAAYPAR